MILCCGECLIDMLPVKTDTGSNALQPHTGGAVFNTAIALGRLGAKVGFCSGVSSDLFGKQIADELTKNNVDGRFLIQSDRPTTLAFVQLENGQARYVFYDENSAGRMIQLDDFGSSIDDVSCMFFGGISLISEPAADSYQEYCAKNSSTKLVYIDPNIRPGFVRDEVRYRQRLDEMIRCSDIVKMSDEDLIWLANSTDLKAAIGDILDRGPKLVLLTKGANGVEAHWHEGHIECPTPNVEVVDTVGAGDTFNAGFLSVLQFEGCLQKGFETQLDEQLLKAALDLGVRSAAVSVSRAGANPPFADELT